MNTNALTVLPFTLMMATALLGGCANESLEEPEGPVAEVVPSSGESPIQSDSPPLEAASEQDLSFQSVRVDGILYPVQQISEHFGEQDLHWLVTQETLDQGIPTAFTSEEERNAAFGLDEAKGAASEEQTADAAVSAYLYQHIKGKGRRLTITGNAYNLTEQNFNDKTSSVRTYRNVILYQHAKMRGCSLGIEYGIYVRDLRGIPFCGGGNWNDRTSSVRAR